MLCLVHRSPLGAAGASPALAVTAQQAVPATQDLSTLQELQAISQATICSADNRDYKLRALFLNVVGDPAARVKVCAALPATCKLGSPGPFLVSLRLP